MEAKRVTSSSSLPASLDWLSQYESLFDHSSDLIFFFDAHFRLLFANQTALRKLGRAKADIPKTDFFKWVDKTERKEARLLFEQAIDLDELRIQTMLVTRFEKNLHINGYISAIKHEDGQILGYQLLGYDITERIRAERAQALYYKIASLAVNTDSLSQLYAFIYDQLQGIFRIKNFNIALRTREHWSYVFSRQEEENHSKEVENLLADYVLDLNQSVIIYKDGIEKIAEQKRLNLTEKIPEIWLGVVIHLADRPSGVVSMFSYRDRAAYNNRDLELIDYLGSQIGLAISREQSEATIQNQAARLSAIFNSSTHQVWSVDRAYRFTSFNENYRTDFAYYYGYYPEVGRPKSTQFELYLNDSNRSEWKEHYDRCFQGEVVNFQIQSQAQDNKTVWRDVFMHPIGTTGEIQEVSVIANDITTLNEAHLATKRAQEIAEHSLKVKEQFLANMSHEIRTPMNGIMGMIDLLGLTRLDEEQSEYLKTVRQSSKTLLDIVNDILDLSKIEAGMMELKLAPVNLVKTFEKVYALYSQPAHLRNNAFYYHLDPRLPEWVLADETRLVQVLSNLTSNAIKFSRDNGNINLSIRVMDVKEDTYLFKVSVKDSGIGISKEDQEQLFQSFRQIDSSRTKTYEGTGLGLVISKELVENMGGQISVVSTPGLGSTFWFTFEAVLTTPPKADGQRELQLPKFTSEQPNILLVDDNPINRNVASKILQKAGCLVTEAANGEDAIRCVHGKSYDLIFMDIQMPGKDGVETMQEIKEIKLDTTPPIVAMTAYSMEDDLSRFMSQGMDDYLPKPIKAFQLVEMVKKWTRFQPSAIAPDEFQESGSLLAINQNTLNQLRKYGGDELIQSSLLDYESDTKQLLANIKSYFEKGDTEDLRRELHTLKGNSGTLGIEKMAAQSAEMEMKVKANTFEGLEDDIETLVAHFQEFQENSQNILNTNEQADIVG